jgi:hypothetical protein
MEEAQRKRLIRQRGVTKASLTCKKNTLTLENTKFTNYIFCKFEAAQNELELQDDVDHFSESEAFQEQYYKVRAKFAELMYPGNIKSPANSIPAHSSSSG